MTHFDTLEVKDEVRLTDLFRPIVKRAKFIGRGTIVAALAAALIGGAYFLKQPVRRSAFLEFRPVFEGADAGRYPNGLPFAATDVINASIVDQVHEKNRIRDYCSAELFHGGFTVQESSPELRFLNMEYEARLSDARLSSIERQRLQDEYAGRRASIRPHYSLAFIQPAECAVIPQSIVLKSMGEVLETWADDAQNKRGVMKVRISVLTPATFDQTAMAGENLLVRADLLRTALGRVIDNVKAVETLPGAELIRGSDQRTSLQEVRAELEDLMHARLNPLIAQAGRGVGRESTQWIQHSLETATIRLKSAEQRTEAYRTALREYSGVQAPAAAPPGERQPSPSDVQALTPQIDRTFIDRIVELSSPNMAFRQEITRQGLAAAVEAVNRAAVVEQYRQLLQSVSSTGSTSMSPAAVSAAIDQVTAQAKEATRRFNDIYNEFSRVSLRAGTALYRVERPAESVTIRAFGLRDYVLLLLGVLLATPLVLALAVLLAHHGRKFVHSVD